ncbi:MAG: hypothetical protein HC898_03775 [Phycisphaerales bacterium]|nr:hypothetical protein [Phycisphaerales bacterium]
MAWGLEPGRPMPLAVNSSLLRVTPVHRAMLEHWAQLLDTEEYLKAQAGPPHERGFHMLTDQEPLAAVLGSKLFADIPMSFLRRGRDVAITCGSAGYTLGERFRNVGQGLPPVIHALGPKPWTHRKYSQGHRETWRYIEQVHGQLSPYTIVAREYRELMDEDCSWMDRSTLPAKLMHTMAGGEPNLSALPLCAMDSVGRSIKLALGKYPWQASYRRWEIRKSA